MNVRSNSRIDSVTAAKYGLYHAEENMSQSGHPSGAILVWETDREMPSRDLAVSQAVSPFKGHKLLLDGQQRLTSLSAIVRGEPVVVRKGKKAIQVLFNLHHPEGPPLEVLEIDENSDDGEEGDPDAPEAEKNIQERLKQRTFVVASSALTG